MLNTRFYTGDIYHERIIPKAHSFKYKVFSLCVDLDELDELDKYAGFSLNKFNLLSLYESDYGLGVLGLRRYITDILSRRGCSEASYRVELLCYPRILGYVFNPLSIYFCYDSSNNLRVILYEVTNTFGDRHSYFLEVDDQQKIQQQVEKVLYVSPFMPMDCYYNFDISFTNKRVSALIKLFNNQNENLLNALFTGSSCEFSARSIRRLFFSYPLMTIKVLAGIHWEALKLWRKNIKLVERNVQPKFSITWKDARGKIHYESL